MMTSQRSYELNEKDKRNQINKINRENLKKKCLTTMNIFNINVDTYAEICVHTIKVI